MATRQGALLSSGVVVTDKTALIAKRLAAAEAIVELARSLIWADSALVKLLAAYDATKKDEQ